MFKDAIDNASARDEALRDELTAKLEHLERTAATWYDETLQSLQARAAESYGAAGLCARVIAAGRYDDDVERALLSSLADDLRDQGDKLSQLREEARMDEGRDDLPVFSSRDLSDDSSLSPVSSAVDWELFAEVESRQFVADNADATADHGEMQDRAYRFASSAVSGHGLSRQSKVTIVTSFLEGVEQAAYDIATAGQKALRSRTSRKESVDVPDAALYL